MFKMIPETLPNGEIKMSDINTELNTPIMGERSIGQSDGRNLVNIPYGEISMSDYRGKSNFSFIIIVGRTVQEDVYFEGKRIDERENYGYSDSEITTEYGDLGYMANDISPYKIVGCLSSSYLMYGVPYAFYFVISGKAIQLGGTYDVYMDNIHIGLLGGTIDPNTGFPYPSLVIINNSNLHSYLEIKNGQEIKFLIIRIS